MHRKYPQATAQLDAAVLGIEGAGRMRKYELIEAIEGRQTKSADG